MKVRFIKPYHMYTVGEIIEPNKPIREILLQRKLVEIVEDQEETAAIEPPENAKKKRGRPRKRGLF